MLTSIGLPHLTAGWFDAIPRRISSRRFDGVRLSPILLDGLAETCRRLSTAGRIRAVLVREAPPEVFTGLVGSYGRVEGAPTLAVLVGPPEAALEAGYIGEGVVLAATAAGIDSVWIAASFDSEQAGALADLRGDERVHAIVALGHATQKIASGERLMRTFVRARHRLPLETIAPMHTNWPEWAREAATAVRLAPSGANKQPWRLHMDGDALVLTRAPKVYWTAMLDFGIAMLHAELGAAHAGVCGTWIVRDGEEVARFVPGPGI